MRACNVCASARQLLFGALRELRVKVLLPAPAAPLCERMFLHSAFDLKRQVFNQLETSHSNATHTKKGS